MAGALMVSKSLQNINLGQRHIGNKGTEILATSFKENQSLRMVWLDNGNGIGDKEAKNSADVLK